MGNRVVGYLKFSEHTLGADGVSYWEKLKQGELFFNNFNAYENAISDAQRALEGTTELIQFVEEKKNESKVIMSGPTGDVIISIAVGASFENNGHVIKHLSGAINNGGNVRYSITPEGINEQIQTMKNSSNDIILYPVRYKKPITVYRDSKFYEFYDYEDMKLEIIEKSTCNWKVSCFLTICLYDLEQDGTLKKEFISSLKTKHPIRGSIALNNLDEERPWVYIPNEVMYNLMLENKDILVGGDVRYYKSEDYPYSFNEIIANPHKILLAKDESYKEQREFRLIAGGPNDLFKGLEGDVLMYNWGQFIQYGSDLTDLEKIKLI
ncbi:TPA: hypothetical protein U1248_001391 [Streptococcus suis]|nr:hypothetical protein [Streptococcus suis]